MNSIHGHGCELQLQAAYAMHAWVVFLLCDGVRPVNARLCHIHTSNTRHGGDP
jgi:hypothetical protein